MVIRVTPTGHIETAYMVGVALVGLIVIVGIYLDIKKKERLSNRRPQRDDEVTPPNEPTEPPAEEH